MRMPLSLGLAFIAMPSVAAAQAPATDGDACMQAYVKTQELRLEKKLIEAKRQAAACMAQTCPEVATTKCATWSEEIDKALPSVVLRYVDEQGKERNDVTVTVDGQPFSAELDGSAIPIDPGPHRFTFAVAGGAPVERQITIAEGEKLRQITVSLAKKAEPLPGKVHQPPKEEASVHPAGWVLYAVSALGLGVFAGLAAQSLSMEDCEPLCTEADIDDIHLVRALADVSLGIGVLALGGAVWITVASLTGDDDTEVGIAAIATPGGPVPGLSVSF